MAAGLHQAKVPPLREPTRSQERTRRKTSARFGRNDTLFNLRAIGSEVGMDEKKRYEQGLKIRREVLGDAHVDRSLANRDAFNEEFQDLITRYAWGEIWSRPGLDKPTRSMITLALMVALNRGDEFRMHVRAALNNGVTREEIKEVLLQCAIYCGVPAANSAFHEAKEVLGS
jgi:4-carboxymuconolactone decarboxylase